MRVGGEPRAVECYSDAEVREHLHLIGESDIDVDIDPPGHRLRVDAMCDDDIFSIPVRQPQTLKQVRQIHSSDMGNQAAEVEVRKVVGDEVIAQLEGGDDQIDRVSTRNVIRETRQRREIHVRQLKG